MLVYMRMLEDMNLIVKVNHTETTRDSILNHSKVLMKHKDLNLLMLLCLIVIRAMEDNRMYVSQNILVYFVRELTLMIIVGNIHPLVVENNPIRVAVS